MTPHCFKFLAIQRHDSSIVVGPSSKDEKALGDPLQPGEADAAGHPAGCCSCWKCLVHMFVLPASGGSSLCGMVIDDS